MSQKRDMGHPVCGDHPMWATPGKANVRSQNSLLNLLDGESYDIRQVGKPGPQLCTQSGRNLLDAYLNSETAITAHLRLLGPPFDSELTDYKLTFEIISGSDSHLLDNDSRHSYLDKRRALSDVRSNKMQVLVPVMFGAVVDDEKRITNNGLLRVVRSFGSVARLYRTKPRFELCGQVDFLKCCILEGTQLFDNREVKLAFIGGRIGSSDNLISLPHSRVQSRSELIKVLTQFEGQRVVGNNLRDDLKNSIPVVPQLGNDSIGFIAAKQDVAAVNYSFRVSSCPIDALPTFLER